MADVGTKLIFENDRVRVWEFTLAPGESIGAHFFYPIEGGTLTVTRATGAQPATLEAGKVYYRTAGDTHGATNLGPRRYHEVLVELKDSRPAA